MSARHRSKRSSTNLLRTHEQKMLHGMGHAWHVFLITEVTDIDVERGAGLVRLIVVYKESLELVR